MTNYTSYFAHKLSSNRKAMQHYKSEKLFRRAVKLSRMWARKASNPLRVGWIVKVNRNSRCWKWEGGYVF